MFFFIAGCSGSDNIVTPNGELNYLNVLPVTSLAPVAVGSNITGIMGVYELLIDTDSNIADLIALRKSLAGESYTVDVTSFFTGYPCSDCLKLESIRYEDDLLIINFEIEHPFQPGNPEDPPTAINRLDLDIFDTAFVFSIH